MPHCFRLWAFSSSGLFFLLLSGPYGLLRAEEGSGKPDPGPVVEGVFSQIEDQEGDKFWLLADRLDSLGKDAVPALRAKLPKAGEKGKLAAAKSILHLGDVEARSEATKALESLAKEAGSKELKVAAMEILAGEGDPDEVQPFLEGIFDAAKDPAIVIPLARALWDLDHVARARDRLVDLMGSRDAAVKQEAALALAEIDYFEGDVREVLRTLKRDPSPQGRRAANLDRILKLSRQLDRSVEKGDVVIEGADSAKLLKIKEERLRELEDRLDRASKSGAAAARSPIDSFFEEILLQIQKSYVDEAKTKRDRLILNAVKGMVHSLDDFSSFMDVEDTKSFRRSMAGEYPGIGATVNKPPEGPLEILRPIYGGPAYKAGILSGDRVLEVDGVRTDDFDVDDIVERLRGPKEEIDSKVTLKILRRGWSEPKDFTFVRAMVEVPSVHFEMLPGKIGYLQLTQFGDKAAAEFTNACDQLEKDGMAGFVLDLRSNPGGLLDAAVKIVDEFVGGDLPIVTQKGRRGKGNAGEEVATYPKPDARPNYPMVVLVNGRSASASEIVSGALQDLGRATLVGKRTFGKGSVQRLIPISSESQKALGGDAQLRLTVQYYFLPLGRCIHTIRDDKGAVVEEGGVKPDVDVAEERLPAWRIEERERLRGNTLILDYIDKHWAEIKTFFESGDDHNTSRYPGFDELYAALATTAPKDDVRSILRFHVRRRIEDGRGAEFASDFQEDAQLQRAILEVLKKLGDNPQNYPRYASLLSGSTEQAK